jgi:nitroimidazol reductase NimA-like FMN-containing flavoprotein (pyridoxamine 5'-phosphate oxidase superfamily)
MPDERTAMRRADRAIDDDSQIRALLERGKFFTLASSVDDQPYTHVSLYWFDATTNRIYFHTAGSGRTRSNIELNPRVSMAVAEVGQLLPADTALEFSVEYASVIAFGRARVVEQETEARYGLQGLLDKYFPELRSGEDYRPITDEELRLTSVFALEIEEMSGKRKVAVK